MRLAVMISWARCYSYEWRTWTMETWLETNFFYTQWIELSSRKVELEFCGCRSFWCCLFVLFTLLYSYCIFDFACLFFLSGFVQCCNTKCQIFRFDVCVHVWMCGRVFCVFWQSVYFDSVVCSFFLTYSLLIWILLCVKAHTQIHIQIPI